MEDPRTEYELFISTPDCNFLLKSVKEIKYRDKPSKILKENKFKIPKFIL